MQWHHHLDRGPGPPAGTVASDPGTDDKGKPIDPLDSKWRAAAGWKLKVIGYYSKTLDDAQKHYPAFDKEAGAALLSCRHWSDLITYHPTTLYTDSSVATSMLTKHIAPPRLQRWGAELGAFLPHLRISYRKGQDNGLADLLSRYPAFRKYAATRDEIVTLPDDYFDYIGEAPLYHRIPSTRRRGYLANARYELYKPKSRPALVDAFWVSTGAPEIPIRGAANRVTPAASELAIYAMNDASESRAGPWLTELLHSLRQDVMSFASTYGPDADARPGPSIFANTFMCLPTFSINGASPLESDLLSEAIETAGGHRSRTIARLPTSPFA
jgi:hypothetical protein